MLWTRFVGTSAYDEIRGTAFDLAGNAYAAGSSDGSFGGFTNSGSADLFVARYDAAGNQTLLQQFGSAGIDNAMDVVADVSGNIYLTGRTTGALRGQLNAGGDDAFIMKLDRDGNVLWTRLFGGSAEYTTDGALMGTAFISTQYHDGIFGLAVTPDGSAYVTGATAGSLGYTGSAGGGMWANGNDFVAKITNVPEPSVVLLLTSTGVALVFARRRR